jgi:hypothetical protein
MQTKALDDVSRDVARFLGSTLRRVEDYLNKIFPFFRKPQQSFKSVNSTYTVPKSVHCEHKSAVNPAPAPGHYEHKPAIRPTSDRAPVHEAVNVAPVLVKPHVSAKTEPQLKGVVYDNKVEALKGEIFYTDILSPSRLTRMKALEKIKELAPHTAISMLEKALAAETDTLRVTELLNTLASLGSAKGVPKYVFLPYCEDHDAGVRLTALRAVSKYPDDESLRILGSHTKDTDPEVRRQALNCICWEFPDMCESYALRMLHDLDPRVRKTACQIVGALKLKQSISSLITLLSDADKSVQEAASTVLKKLTGEDFGFKVTAAKNAKDTAVEDWRFWWRDNQTKFANIKFKQEV